jgi:hypothetical protein
VTNGSGLTVTLEIAGLADIQPKELVPITEKEELDDGFTFEKPLEKL